MSARSISPLQGNNNNNNNEIASMPISAHLHAAVDQCIDALCFAGTHNLDLELRAQPKSSQTSYDRLIAEQQRRVEETFGAHHVSPDTLASVLDELFKLDSSSISDRMDEPGQQMSPVVDIMTDTTAKIFKKEMKQRIHEWEGAFRDQYGKDPSPQDKNRLKHIYELYKIVKIRVLKGPPDQPAGTAAPNTNIQQQASTSATTTSASISQGGNNSTSNNNNTSSRSGTPGNNNTNTAVAPNAVSVATPSRNQPSVNNSMPSPSMTPAFNLSNQGNSNNNNNLGANVQLTPMNNSSSRPNSAPGSNNNQQGGSASRASTPNNNNTNTGASATPTTANVPQQQQQLGNPTSTTLVATSRAQFDTLLAEKRTLKRRLHAFEGDFQKQNGRAPTRDDRLPLINSYQRYGELKLAIQNWQNEHGGGVVED